MRILVTSTIGLGHLLPVLRVAGLLAAAEHEITVASPAVHGERVRAAGLRHVPVPAPSPSEIAELVDSPGAGPGAREQKIFGRLNPLTALPFIERVLHDWRPDIVVSEAAEFGGGLAAARTGLPWVRVHPGAIYGWLWERTSAPELDRVRTELGLPADPDLRWLLEPPQLSRFPAAFEPTTDTPSVLRWRLGEPPPPIPSADRDDTVYLTFGTEISGMPPFADLVRASVAAVHSAGLRPILSVHQANPTTWTHLEGVSVHRWVDQDAVLARTRAVIFHGGAGTLLGAITAGTPAVIIPLFADQPFNAARLAELNAGLVENPGPNLAERLAASLRQLLAEPRPACQSLADAIRELPDQHAAVDLIQQAAA